MKSSDSTPISTDPLLDSTSEGNLPDTLSLEPYPTLVPFVFGDLELPAGLYPVVGSTGVGKTRFLDLIASTFGSPVFTVNEPYSPVHPDAPEVGRLVVKNASVTSLVRGFPLYAEQREFPKILLIDSLRTWLWAKGAAGSRGLDANLGSRLTALSNLVAEQGLLAFATLNPSYRDPEFVARVTDVALESTVGAVQLSGWNQSMPVGSIAFRPIRQELPLERLFRSPVSSDGGPSLGDASSPIADPASGDFLFLDLVGESDDNF